MNVGLDTPFSVADVGERAKTFFWGPDTAGPLILLTTTGNCVTIPDPTAHGLAIGLPPGADYDWAVFGHGVEGMGEDALLGGFAGYIDLLYTLMIGGGPQPRRRLHAEHKPRVPGRAPIGAQ